MANIIAEGEAFERFSLPGRCGETLPGPEAGSEGRARPRPASRTIRPSASTARGVRRPLPRPAHSGRQQGQGVQARERRRLVLEGDAANKQLQRLYGTAFFDKKDQETYLNQIEEAKLPRPPRARQAARPVHHLERRRPGTLPVAPQGATIRATLEEFIKAELLRRGYEPVYSPHIGRVEMYETSGHFPYYRESQFPPLFGHPAGQTGSTIGRPASAKTSCPLRTRRN